MVLVAKSFALFVVVAKRGSFVMLSTRSCTGHDSRGGDRALARPGRPPLAPVGRNSYPLGKEIGYSSLRWGARASETLLPREWLARGSSGRHE